jgi:tyrosine-protein phosphatase SIW14
VNVLAVVLGLALSAGAEKSVEPAGGIPNFSEVSPGVYRGGQPTDEGWAFLKAKGVKTVIKLDLPFEGSDDGAAALGMKVVDASGPPADFRGAFGAPAPERIRLAVATLEDEKARPVFIHCRHGQDRTGLIVGLYRVLHEHVAKKAAWAEMKKHGFHRALHGLREVWERFDGKSLEPGGASR